jgi:hypothetical protein
MFILTTWWLRIFGLAGVLGAILFICGDLLYNHIPGSSLSPTEKMGRMTESRLLNAGTLGLIGCWFYTLASMHLYLAFLPVGKVFAFILLLAFGMVMICYGISHTAYFSIAAGAQAALKAGAKAETGGRLGNAFFTRLVSITYVPVAIVSGMMAYGILSTRSLYSWWMVFFLPVVLYLLKAPIVRILKGHLREVVNDSYDNVVLFVFFLLSTIILWNGVVL